MPHPGTAEPVKRAPTAHDPLNPPRLAMRPGSRYFGFPLAQVIKLNDDSIQVVDGDAARTEVRAGLRRKDPAKEVGR